MTPNETDLRPAPAAVDAAARPANLFASLHRHLRGRYPWAIALILAGTLGGAALGVFTTKPLYRSQGLLYVEPSLPSPRDPAGERVPPMLSAFVQAQVDFMQDSRVIRRALENPEWRKLDLPQQDGPVEAFREGLSVLRPQAGLHLVVSFEHPDPRAAVAGLKALVEAYQDLSLEKNQQPDKTRYEDLQARATTLSSQIEDLNRSILKAAEEFGSPDGLAKMEGAYHQQFVEAMAELSRVRRGLRIAEGAAPPETTAPAPAGDLPPDEIGLRDAQMAGLLREREGRKAEILRLQTEEELGEQHPRLKAARAELERVERWIVSYAETWNRATREGRSPRPPANDAEREVTRLRAEEQIWLAAVDLAREKTKELGSVRSRIEDLQLTKKSREDQLQAVNLALEEIRAELMGKGRVRELSAGELPSRPSKDKRFQNALVLGALFGGLGLVVMLLIARLDRRFRYSSDLGAEPGSVPLLGLLPSIPTKDAPDETWKVADVATQQIRTMVQIVLGRREGKALCVGGGCARTGKTTLAFVLGLGSAGAGLRTLLVDGDPLGRGLTTLFNRLLLRRLERRLDPEESGEPGWNGTVATEPLRAAMGLFKRAGHRTAEPLLDLARRAAADLPREEAGAALLDLARYVRRGLSPEERERFLAAAPAAETGLDPEALRAEAEGETGLFRHLAGRPLADCAEGTGLVNLSLLPLARCAAERAAGLSVGAVNLLLTEARRDFDLVLVDTGPLPGDPTASLFAAATDLTVLVCSRGDERPHIARTIAHLKDLRAEVAGLIFNRAGFADAVSSSYSQSQSSRSRSLGE